MPIKRRFRPTLKKTMEAFWQSRDMGPPSKINAWEQEGETNIRFYRAPLIAELIEDVHGERATKDDPCETPDCEHCAIWAQYDELVAAKNELKFHKSKFSALRSK